MISTFDELRRLDEGEGGQGEGNGMCVLGAGSFLFGWRVKGQIGIISEAV